MLFPKELMLIKQMHASEECDICHYWYFLNKGFKFQPNVSNKCYYLLMMCMNFSDIVILSIQDAVLLYYQRNYEK